MKRSRMSRLASFLLAAVLMTTCTISGTFAKYVTAADAADSARVAKWGVTVEATGSLYGEKYAADTSKITASEDEDVVSVWGKQATDLNKVVAPGTQSDEGFHFALNGKPEVDALVTVNIEHQNVFLAAGNYGVMVEVPDVTEDNFVANKYFVKNGGVYEIVPTWPATEPTAWYALHDAAEVANADGYWPVVYTMDGETTYAGDVNDDTLKALAKAIAAKIDAGATGVQDTTDKSKYTYTDVQKEIEQNTDFSDAMNLGDIAISWAWEFDGVNDGADTILGNLMAMRLDGANYNGEVVKLDTPGAANTYVALVEGTDFCLDTNFSIELLVEQVD